MENEIRLRYSIEPWSAENTFPQLLLYCCCAFIFLSVSCCCCFYCFMLCQALLKRNYGKSSHTISLDLSLQHLIYLKFDCIISLTLFLYLDNILELFWKTDLWIFRCFSAFGIKNDDEVLLSLCLAGKLRTPTKYMYRHVEHT